MAATLAPGRTMATLLAKTMGVMDMANPHLVWWLRRAADPENVRPMQGLGKGVCPSIDGKPYP
jgi:hypothetical protein